MFYQYQNHLKTQILPLKVRQCPRIAFHPRYNAGRNSTIKDFIKPIKSYKVNYEVTNNDLNKLFDNGINNEFNNEINNIVLTVKENSDLIKIELDFSNYMKTINNESSLYKVLIEYEY